MTSQARLRAGPWAAEKAASHVAVVGDLGPGCRGNLWAVCSLLLVARVQPA